MTQQIQITQKQHDDIGTFFDLLKSDSGVIETLYLNPDGTKKTEYFNEKQAFIQSVVAFNHNGFTCYAGIQPRKVNFLNTNRSATGADITALRILAVDLDACKPLDKDGNKRKVNATNQEKLACINAARMISDSLTNGNMHYQQAILTDSGSGCWLFMPIPEIALHDGNRREIAVRLKTWGRRFKERFQQEGVEIDESIFEMHRLTKIPGTKVFSYPEEKDRPQRISGFLSDATPIPDKKLQQDFLTMPVVIPPEPSPVSSTAGETYRNIDRLFEHCRLMRFLAEQGSSGVSMPHNIRLALSTFSLALDDLKNNLNFIRRIIGGSPDFSEAKTRHYLELNKDKSAPYGCDAMRELVKQHFKDFDVLQCECALPVSHDQAGRQRKPSPIRFAGIMPEDLTELFSGLELSGDPFSDFLKMKSFAEGPLADVDVMTAKKFFETVPGNVKINKQTVNDLLKARKASTAEDTTQAQRLIELAKGAELFRTPEDQIFATFQVEKHKETWPIKGSGFRNWLKRQYYKETGRPPSSQPLQDALGILEAKGQFDGAEHKVFIRIAEHGDNIYIDLCNDRWEAIEISPTGWKVVQNYPVRFRRTRGMGLLPYPVQGSVEAMKKYLNLSNDDDFKLIVAWLVATLKSTGPYPILVLNGEQGTAKSTVSRILKRLIDPSSAPLRTIPKEERDLSIAANNNWLLAFDNLSGLPKWLSDAICRLATGGGFSTRELYSNDQESIFNAMRSVVLNGIEDFVTKHDLADRSLIIHLSPIPENKRIAEKGLWQDFEDDAPGILGALCDAVSCGLRNINIVKFDRLPRMADFALWVTAAEPVLPWLAGDFMRAYTRNLKDAIEQTIDADLVASAIRSFMESHREGFEGTPTDLLNILDDEVEEKTIKSKSWPKGPHILTGRLRRAATSLRSFGIEVKTGFKLANKKRGVSIKNTGNASSTRACKTSPEASPLLNNNIEACSDITKAGDGWVAGDASFAAYSDDGNNSVKREI